jgi:hypothetical protein
MGLQRLYAINGGSPYNFWPHKTPDNFDFTFNPKMHRGLVFDPASNRTIA